MQKSSIFVYNKKTIMNKLTYLLLILTATLILHLIEEIKTGFRKRFPLGKMSVSLFVELNIIIYALIGLVIYFNITAHAWAELTAVIYAVFMILNAGLHIGMMIKSRAYFPGGITAFLLLPIAIYVLIIA